ncbi:MAG: ABC transporter ATP-binding protein, partial [Halodesulfurarchaeum sp.]
LSGGEKRLVTIAAVHAGNPDVMALDEPTSGLDMTGWNRLGERIETIDGTVLLVTHDTDFAWRYADSVLVLSGAGLERQGPTEAVLGDPDFDLAAVGLTTPSPVVWARNRGIEPPPTTVTEALSLLEEES